MYKETYKFRLYPTPAQTTKLEQTLEICCWTYNEILTYRKNLWENEHKNCGRFGTGECINQCKEKRQDLYNVHSQVFQNINERVDIAIRKFIQRLKKNKNPGYPRYKSIKQYNSFTFPTHGMGIHFTKLGLSISKIGMIKVIQHRQILDNCYIKRITIIKKNDKWFCYLSCNNHNPIVKSCGSGTVGIDLGCKTFAVLSNGERIENQKLYIESAKTIRKIEKKLFKTKEKTHEREKVVKVLNKIHFRIKNRRRDFLHKESRKLVNKYENLIFKDLDIAIMLKHKKSSYFNFIIKDCSWDTFVRFCSYKAENAGGRTVLVPAKNTTQMCSTCGAIMEIGLEDRTFHCTVCENKKDRDLNSSINILRLGQQSLRKLKDL